MLRYYGQCLSILLEQYDRCFATKIATFADLRTIEQASEWSHAFRWPSDLASSKRVLPSVFARRPRDYPAHVVRVLVGKRPNCALPQGGWSP